MLNLTNKICFKLMAASVLLIMLFLVKNQLVGSMHPVVSDQSFPGIAVSSFPKMNWVTARAQAFSSDALPSMSLHTLSSTVLQLVQTIKHLKYFIQPIFTFFQ